MTIRIRTHICSSIAVAAVILAVAAPNAFAATSTGTTITISKWLANFHEPGSTGYVPASTLVTIPKSLANFHEPGSTGYVPASALVTTTTAVDSGLNWVSALIGLGAGIGIAVASAGGLLAARRRRTVVHP